MENITKIVITHTTRIYREGIERYLERYEEFDVLSSDDELEMRAFFDQATTNIAIIDLTVAQALESLFSIPALIPTTKLIAITSSSDSGEQVSLCAQAHVAGLISRNDSLEELVTCIRAVSWGKTSCTSQVTQELLSLIERPKYRSSQEAEEKLTRRQSNVLELMERGYPNKKIANQLNIEVSTVKNHVHSILQKLHVDNRTEAAAKIRH